MNRWLIAACLLTVVASSGCATSPWFNRGPGTNSMAGRPADSMAEAPRRGFFPGMRNRLREMMPGSAAPEQSPEQQASATRPGPSAEAVSITVGDE